MAPHPKLSKNTFGAGGHCVRRRAGSIGAVPARASGSTPGGDGVRPAGLPDGMARGRGRQVHGCRGLPFGFPDALAFILYTSVSGLEFTAIVSRLALTGKLSFSECEMYPRCYDRWFTRERPRCDPPTSVMLPYACAIVLCAFCVVLSHSVSLFPEVVLCEYSLNLPRLRRHSWRWGPAS